MNYKNFAETREKLVKKFGQSKKRVHFCNPKNQVTRLTNNSGGIIALGN